MGGLTELLRGSFLTEMGLNTVLSDFLMEAPECFLAAILLWLIFRFAPDCAKGLLPLGDYYTTENRLAGITRRAAGSHISRRVTMIIVGEAAVLSIFAAVFANLLLPSVMAEPEAQAPIDSAAITQAAGEIVEGLPEGMRPFGEKMQRRMEKDMASDMGMDTKDFLVLSRDRIGFDLKLIMMIMTLAVPIAVLVNYYAQRSIAEPVGRLARYLKRFAEASGDEEALVSAADSITGLDIRNRDEIGELYRSVGVMSRQLVDSIGRIRNEAKLENDLKIAQAASGAKSAFLSNMSHEIRTPINAVLGMDEMILRESEEDSTIEYATAIRNAGSSLLSLVNDILDFSKIEAGRMEILPVQYDLASTINDLVNMIAIRAQEKHLSLLVRVDEKMPHLLCGDEIRIKQVVTNILTNAVKYTEKGSVTLEIGYAPVTETEDEEGNPIDEPSGKIWLQVRVTDTGIGIREEDLEKLFSPFERIDEIRNRTVEGTGLGMSIVKKLLAMMHTRVEVKSVYGEGSDFSFRVLQEVVDDAPIGDFEVAYRKSTEGRKRYRESFHAPDARILVTDDTRMNLTVICALLKATRIVVDTASGGRETLEKIRNTHYDVIFIDHMMPEMDGIETLEAMRALSAEENKSFGVPVVVLTANAVSGAREMYLEAGFCDYLTKPVDAGKLEKLLRSLLPPVKLLPADDGDEPGLTGQTDEQEDTLLLKKLRTVPHIDLEAALAATGGEEVLAEVMRDFVLTVPEKCERIERFVREENWREYTVLVHALKSSARLIGALELSAEAERLEACGNAEDADEIVRATPALVASCRACEADLSPVTEEASGADDREEIDAAMLADARESLKEAVTAQDFDSADEIFSMLKEYRLPEEEQRFWDEVRRRLAAVDRDGLLGML
ncbi:MAG: response regulator [Lachnospiraceae bacterium]|nr:response regulator [Lachnospiraceae bacterium]